MGVEQILVTGLRFRRSVENDGIAVEITVDVVLHDSVGEVDHPVGHHLADANLRLFSHNFEKQKRRLHEFCHAAGR
jgi:hypothetical protein